MCPCGTELGWWAGYSTPPLQPQHPCFTRKKLSNTWESTFYPSPGEDALLLLAPRRGLTWITQALLYFPAFLGFHAGQAAPGDTVAPYAAPERKFLPAPVSHLDQHLRAGREMSLPDHLRPPEALTLGLHLGHLCIITLHSEGHRTVHRKTCPGLDSRSPAPGRPAGTVANAMPQFIPSSSS